MDTKWKDTVKKEHVVKGAARVKKAFIFLKQNKKYIQSLIPGGIGGGFFYSVIAYRNYHPTEEALFFGLLGNIFLALGITLFMKELLKRRYSGWDLRTEAGYEAWKEKKRILERRLMTIGIAALAAAFWYLTYLTNGGVYGPGGGWNYNYASGYVMVGTVLIQFIICETVLHKFFEKKMDQFMDAMDEINKRRLEEALEIERKSLEKVSRSDQLRVDLITNVSHDLKTPITSIVGYLELIKKEELSDVARDYVDVISDRTDKLKEMINSLFNLAKASSGNIELHPEKFEVNRLIEQIFADLDDRIKNSGLEFVTQLTQESTELVSDNGYFYRICQNLMENALKYSARGTRVFVKTYIKEEKICLEITNTSGYPMDFTKEDIVERFARGDKARSSEGNGLGLAIVSTYAKALGGEFDIRIDCDQFKACLAFPVEQMDEEV